MVVLTTQKFYFSLSISQLMAKAIPVRGAKFKKPAFIAGFLLFCVLKRPDATGLQPGQAKPPPGTHLIFLVVNPNRLRRLKQPLPRVAVDQR